MDGERTSSIRGAWHSVQALSLWIRVASVLPLLSVYAFAPRREDVRADMRRWMAVAEQQRWPWLPHRRRHTMQLLYLLSYHRPFRDLLYYRAKRSVRGRLATKVLRRVYRGQVKLSLDAASIGPGLYIAHGYCTGIAWSVEIGCDCRIHQLVTIGWDGAGRAPRIGDNVVIYTGAVIIGDVTVGDGAIIGANAVVTKDVPAGVVARGVPATYHEPGNVAGQDPLARAVA
ncbi:MAG TPA: serine acetyltransferase [Solirubrobacteraceae bacterium]|jgi:serine O-acetyltransferase